MKEEKKECKIELKQDGIKHIPFTLEDKMKRKKNIKIISKPKKKNKEKLNNTKQNLIKMKYMVQKNIDLIDTTSNKCTQEDLKMTNLQLLKK